MHRLPKESTNNLWVLQLQDIVFRKSIRKLKKDENIEVLRQHNEFIESILKTIINTCKTTPVSSKSILEPHAKPAKSILNGIHAILKQKENVSLNKVRELMSKALLISRETFILNYPNGFYP